MFPRIFLASILISTALATAPAADLESSPESGWPQFRGPRRDGVSTERGLLAEWPADGPKTLWSIDGLGRGYSSPVIVGSRIYLTGDVEGELRLWAMDREGKRLWEQKHGAAWLQPYPGARATPTYSAGRLYLLNAHGRLGCFDAESGKELWALEVLSEFGGKNITWGLSECLLVDDRAVYVTAGGEHALAVALDKASGRVLWKSAALRDSEGEQPIENASYVSPVMVRFADRRLLLGCSLRHLYCIDAATGALQWTRRFATQYSVISMMPAVVGDGVFMTAPHGRDGMFFNLEAPNAPSEPVRVRDSWTTPLDTLQGCLVQVGDRLVGSWYRGRKGWMTMDARTGAILFERDDWVKGAPLYADGRVYAYGEDGWIRLLEVGEREFVERGKFRFAEAKRDAWAHPVLLEGRLYLRYHDKMSCFDVRPAQR